jgi:nucleoside-diphosphate-sugar epimerase
VGDPVGTITSNVFGLYHLLNLAAACKTQRVLFLSSVEVYGQNQYGLDSFSESDMGYIDCNTLRAGYPESKRVAESLCRAYEKMTGLDSVILRLCRIYGPTMPQNDSKALAQFIKNALNGEDIVLKSEGKQFFSYCYVADAVSAILTALLVGKNGEAYNVADPGSNIALRDLAKLIADANGVKVVFELPTADEKQGFSVADRAVLNPEKLNALGWRAVTGIEDGVDKTIKILKAVKEW